ncbi:MAG TPA: hypothetical protein VHY91_24380 [Pirellulales bacterium]|jgi:hypothetical protein|nr:hypothetical protein [Pirellulales bacterium]
MSRLGTPTTDGNSAPQTPEQALRQLFLTLFLRGHSARGLQRSKTPQTIGGKLALTLGLYALIGMLAMVFRGQSVFALSVYLHALTFTFLGMFVASSAGEILFNREEADILLHRPITPKTLLWAKVRVLVDVSLWLAFAFNLAGFFVGCGVPNGNGFFLPAHALSIVLEALFCTGTVIMVYQLCLRWCGRERLENLMTAAQIVVSMGAIIAGQLVPQMMIRADGQPLGDAEQSWWILLLPPAWFAGIDDALTTGFPLRSCILGVAALAATGAVSWIALDRLAGDYATGLQTVGETISKRSGKGGRRWLERLIDRPPIDWGLRNPVTRASFLLTAAYLVRDRDVKLRVYPGMAPMVVMPLMLLLPTRRHADMGGFPIAMCGAYVGLVPMLALAMLQFSQQWQASDVFRCAPMMGPAAICAGARQAVLWLLVMPTLVVVAGLTVLASGRVSELPLLLPGVMALPIYLLLPNLGGRGIPLSLPADEAKATGRGLSFAGVTILSLVLAAVANLCWWAGYFWLFMAAESTVVAMLYAIMRRRVAAARWPSIE